MAKKTVATLQTSSKKLTKAIKMVKSPKSGAYTFSEAIMSSDQVNDWLSKKYIFNFFKDLVSSILKFYS